MAEVRELSVRYCRVCCTWTTHSKLQHEPDDKYTCDFCTEWIKINMKSVNISTGFTGA